MSGSAVASWRRVSAPGSGPMGMERIHSATRPETESTASGWPSPPAQAAGMPTRAATLAGGAFSGPSRRNVAWMAPSSSPAVRASSSVVMSAWTIIGIGVVRSFNDGRSLAAQGFSGSLYLALDRRDGGVVFFEQFVGALQIQLGQVCAAGIRPHRGPHELISAVFLRQRVGDAAHRSRHVAEQTRVVAVHGIARLADHPGQLAQAVALRQHLGHHILDIQVVERRRAALLLDFNRRPALAKLAVRLAVRLAGLGGIGHTLPVVAQEDRAHVAQVVAAPLGKLAQRAQRWDVFQHRRDRHDAHRRRIGQPFEWHLAGEDGRQVLADGKLDRQHHDVGRDDAPTRAAGARVHDSVAARLARIAQVKAQLHACLLLSAPRPAKWGIRVVSDASPEWYHNRAAVPMQTASRPITRTTTRTTTEDTEAEGGDTEV